MTKSNSSVTHSTSNLYKHPWYSQLQLLDNTTNSESQSQLKLKSETPGQMSTSYCHLCKQDLPKERFYRDNRRVCGVSRSCKKCNSEYAKLRRQYTLPANETCHCCQTRPATDWDHDHYTKQFRGWLCHQCNIGIGQFNNNIGMLEKAISYLNTHGN